MLQRLGRLAAINRVGAFEGMHNVHLDACDDSERNGDARFFLDVVLQTTWPGATRDRKHIF
ncbi:MAG: hypothetical protein ACI83P_001464 [Janthinobacterium sp.]|jgi:hypothetical protein